MADHPLDEDADARAAIEVEGDGAGAGDAGGGEDELLIQAEGAMGRLEGRKLPEVEARGVEDRLRLAVPQEHAVVAVRADADETEVAAVGRERRPGLVGGGVDSGDLDREALERGEVG